MTRRPVTIAKSIAKTLDKNKCTSCGVAFVDHLGVVGTCARVKELELLLAEAGQWVGRAPHTIQEHETVNLLKVTISAGLVFK